MNIESLTFIVNGEEYVYDYKKEEKIYLKPKTQNEEKTNEKHEEKTYEQNNELTTLGLNTTQQGGYKNSSSNIFNTFQMSNSINSNLLMGGGISYNTPNYSATSPMKTGNTLNSIFDF